MKYDVKTTITLTAITTVEAESWQEAKEVLKNGCKATGTIKITESTVPAKLTNLSGPTLSFGKAKQSEPKATKKPPKDAGEEVDI